MSFYHTGGRGLNVVGFLVSSDVDVDGVLPKRGFFVGFGLGLAGVVLSHGVGRGFVMKFGSVDTCHDVDVQESEIFFCEFVTEKNKFIHSLAETLAEALNSFDESLKFSNGFFVVVNFVFVTGFRVVVVTAVVVDVGRFLYGF
jgi:hypothetical protein